MPMTPQQEKTELEAARAMFAGMSDDLKNALVLEVLRKRCEDADLDRRSKAFAILFSWLLLDKSNQSPEWRLKVALNEAARNPNPNPLNEPSVEVPADVIDRFDALVFTRDAA